MAKNLPVAWPSPQPTVPPTLPADGTGQLVPFSAQDIQLMDIRRRGMNDGSHVRWNFGRDGTGCTRKFSCAAQYRWNCLIYFVGAATTYTDNAGNLQVSRLVPLTDPEFPAWICTKVEFEPYQYLAQIDGIDGGVANGGQALPFYARCDFTATFELVPFTVAADGVVTSELNRYVTKPGYPGADVSTETHYIGLKEGTIQFASADGASRPAGIPIPYASGFPEHFSKFSVIWRRLPLDAYGQNTTLFDRIFGIVSGQELTPGILGSLNLLSFLGNAPLTVQLIGVEDRLLPDPTGLGYSWDLKYTFSRKNVPFGHLGYYWTETNKPPLPVATNGYYEVLRPAAGAQNKTAAQINDGDSLFNVRDFGELFIVGND